MAAVEFAVCLPMLLLFLAGLWEVGRIVEVEQVMFNCAREGARDASLASDNLPTITANLLTYLQAAEPNAFGQGHATSIAAATGLPANTYGYTVTDTTANRELFTVTYTDLTTTTVTDPSNANKGDIYQIGIQVPYSTVTVSPLLPITNNNRLYSTVSWMCLRDTPFSVPTTLPAQ